MKRLGLTFSLLALAILLAFAPIAMADGPFTKITHLLVQGITYFLGAVDMDSTLNVDGATTLTSTLDVTGATTMGTLAPTTMHASGGVRGTTATFSGALIASSATITGTETNAAMHSSGGVRGTTATFSGAVIAGSETITGTLAVTGAQTNSSSLSVGTFLVASVAATQTLTAGGTLNPTGTYQPITADAAIGLSSITIKNPGTMLFIKNVGAQTIVFTDTGTLILGGDATLSAADTLLLISDGTNWTQWGSVPTN